MNGFNKSFPIVLAATLAALLPATAFGQTLPAFPGAEGWGAETAGGRGGQVIIVDTLEDTEAADGRTSLREAIMTPGPRMILFSVSGVIYLKEPLYIGSNKGLYDFGKNPYDDVTIAGQSAPGGGITLDGFPLMITNHVEDVVVRFLRFRNSYRDLKGENGPKSMGDGIAIDEARRVVIDHCSVAWATDEAISFETNENFDITIQYSIVAETLLNGGHEAGTHSRGMNVAYGADRIAIHHNFFSSNDRRNAHLVGDRREDYTLQPYFDFRNNLVYNWGSAGTHMGFGSLSNVVGNLFVEGPGTEYNVHPMEMEDDDAGTAIYLEGNVSATYGDVQTNLVKFPNNVVVGVVDEPFAAPSVTVFSLDYLEETVLPLIGAMPHDELDLRLFEEYAMGGGQVGASPTCDEHSCPTPVPAAGVAAPDADGDGMPDEWEELHGLDPEDAADAAGDSDGDGYTNLEQYLNELAIMPRLLFYEGFGGGVLPEGWSYERGHWSAAVDTIDGEPESELGNKIKARAIAEDAFAGCDVCSFEAWLEPSNSFGGEAMIHARLLGWYQGSGTNVSMTLKPEQDKVVFRQKVNGEVLREAAVALALEEGVAYDAKMTFDGADFHVYLNGEEILTTPNGAPFAPFGTIGVQSRNADLCLFQVAVSQ